MFHPDLLGHRAVCISLIASNPLWYARSWLTDIKVTNKILSILTSTSVGWHVQSQIFNKIERTTSCIMTRCLTQPPVALQLWWLLCHYYAIITTKVSSTLLCLPPLKHYKNSTEIDWEGWGGGGEKGNTVSSLTNFLFLSKGFYSFPKSELSFGGCVRTTRPNIFVEGSRKPISQHQNRSFRCHVQRRNSSSIDLVSTRTLL